MRILLDFIKKNKLLSIFTVLALLMQTITILLIPYFTEEIVDIGIAQKNISVVISIAIKMLVVAAIGILFSTLCTYLTAKLSSLLGKNIREDLFKHIQSLSLEDQKQYGPASLATRSSNDVASIQQVLVMVIQMILPGPLIGIVAVLMTIEVSKSLAFIVGLTILAFFISIAYIFYKCIDNMNAIQIKIDNMTAKLREVFMGVKIIRAFDNASYEQKRTDDTFEAHADNIIQINRRFAFISPIAFLLLGLVLTIILWFGLFDVSEGLVQIGTITAVIEYVTLALLQLLAGALVTVMIPRSIASLSRIEMVLNHEPSVIDSENLKDREYSPDVKDIVKFNNVRFQYPGADSPVLNDITFSCQRGKTLAIIGATASGKSTLAKVLLRLDDIQGGEVLLGDVDIKNLSQNFIREHISYVPQKAFLFSGTIRDNLKYADSNITDEQMYKAAEIAQAAPFISTLENGYESFVARGGNNFSGGQKQRLCIARALAKQADVYIFDDSFSALDNQTDANVRKAIKENIKNSAIIIVAQKLSSIVDADEIIVLDKGRIVGKGTHEQLLKNNKVYQEFASSQQLKGVS